jgi:hypothetical protein
MDSDSGGDEDGRADPAIERVRRDLADLRAPSPSAPGVPPEVTERIVAALRSAQPGHTVERPRLRRRHVVGLVIGLGAVLLGAVVGAVMLARGPASSYPRGPTAEQITVTRPAAGFPASDAEIVTLLSQPPDYGPLADPQRRASCLEGLGVSADVSPLGAGRIDMRGRPALMLLLPGAADDEIVVMVVDHQCNAAHTGLLANTTITRP